MKLENAKCPNCGGKLEVNAEIERGICIFCGSEFFVNEAIRKFKGEIDGIATKDTSLIRAYQMLEDNDYDGALKAFKRVIELNPTDGEAYYGLFSCSIIIAEYYREMNSRMERCIPEYYEAVYNALQKYGRRAIQYATDNNKEKYEEIINKYSNDFDGYIQQLGTQSGNEKSKSGCYIATAVYGSYDAPEVIILRKFRDEVLLSNYFGKMFVKIYYTVSPPIANWLKNEHRINILVKNILNSFVSKLTK